MNSSARLKDYAGRKIFKNGSRVGHTLFWGFWFWYLAMINLHKFDDSSFTHSKDKKKGPKFKTGLIWMLSYLLG